MFVSPAFYVFIVSFSCLFLLFCTLFFTNFPLWFASFRRKGRQKTPQPSLGCFLHPTFNTKGSPITPLVLALNTFVYFRVNLSLLSCFRSAKIWTHFLKLKKCLPFAPPPKVRPTLLMRPLEPCVIPPLSLNDQQPFHPISCLPTRRFAHFLRKFEAFFGVKRSSPPSRFVVFACV